MAPDVPLQAFASNWVCTRQSIRGTESGQGSTRLTGQGAQVMTSYGLRVRAKTVIAPLSFGGTSSDLTTLFVGLGLQHQLTDTWSLFASAGVETDLNNPSNTIAVSGLNQLADVTYGGHTVQTRAVFAAGTSFAVTKTQRIGLNYVFRQSPYEGINTNSVFLNDTIGF